MKRLTCEMCGSTDLIKQDGVFGCQYCGCKYTVEEARKLMIEGTVDVVGTVKIDYTDQMEKFIKLSQSAYDSGNHRSAYDYANRALEIAPENPQAWLCKMKAIEPVESGGDMRIREVIETGNRAIACAEAEEVKAVAYQVYGHQILKALALIRLSKEKMEDHRDIKIGSHNLNERLIVSHRDEPYVEKWNYVADEAVKLAMQVPYEVLVENRKLIKLLEFCTRQYDSETDAVISRYAIYGEEVSQTSLNQRQDTIDWMYDRVKKAKIALEEKEAKEQAAVAKKRYDEYWVENAEEMVSLECEKTSIEGEISELQKQIRNVNGMAELRNLQSEIDRLHNLKRTCGMFQLKEKRQIEATIQEVMEQKKEMENKIQRATRPMIDKINQLKNRLDQIADILSMPR